MTIDLSAKQQAQVNNRDDNGRWQQKTHGDVEDGTGVLGLDEGFGADEHQHLADHLENELDGDWHTETIDDATTISSAQQGEPSISLSITDDGRIDARFDSEVHSDSAMLDSAGELEAFAEKSMNAHRDELTGHDEYGPFREVDRRFIQPGRDSGWDDPADRAVHVVSAQGITGYSRIGEPVTERHEGTHSISEYTPHRVTLQNADRHEAEFPHFRGSAYGDEPPTAAETIGSVAEDAQALEENPHIDDFAREVAGFHPEDQLDDPEGWKKVQRDYANIQANSERLKDFLGQESFNELIWGD